MAEDEQTPMWLRLPWDEWVAWVRAGIRSQPPPRGLDSMDVPPPQPSTDTGPPPDYDG